MGQILNIRATGPRRIKGRVLLLYKIAPLRSKRREPSHTNEFEVREIVRWFAGRGLVVDLRDRSSNLPIPNGPYDLLIMLGTGPASSQWEAMSRAFPEVPKILVATHAHPLLEQHFYDLHIASFLRRFHLSPSDLGNISRQTLPASVWNQRVQDSSAIWAYGKEGLFGFDSFKVEKLRVISYPPTSLFRPPPRLIGQIGGGLGPPNLQRFVSYCGKGLIIKGVDILVEAFERHPALHLDIFGPETDQTFNDYVLPRIVKSPNIRFHGFLRGSARLHLEALSQAAHFVSASPSDGTSTSGLTMAALGKPGIATVNSGLPEELNPGNVGVYGSETPQLLEAQINFFAERPRNDHRELSEEVRRQAWSYSPQSFRKRLDAHGREVLSVIGLD